MANLDNLTAKILADSKEKARQALEAAEQEARRIVDEEVAEAEKEKARILDEAKTTAQRTREQIVLAKKLGIRDENLGAKQETLNAVFEEALQKLNAMDAAQYKKFLLSYLPEMETDGQELLLPERFSSIDVEELNEALRNAGKPGNLTLYKGGRKINGGFVLMKDGIEQNNTFEALLDYYRYDLEGNVLKALYE